MKSNKLFAVLAIVAMMAMVATTAFAAERMTRDLVFEDEEQPLAAEAAAEEAGMEEATVISIRTTLELERDGQITQVLPSEQFQSGDRVKFVYMTNTDGYVYWLMEGSTGNYDMLFPSERAGMDNFVSMNTEYTIPTSGAFRFDENPGIEKILVILSKEKLPELEATAQGTTEPTTEVAELTTDNTEKRETRDLIFEEEADEDTGVVTTSQAAPTEEEPFVAYYELTHN